MKKSKGSTLADRCFALIYDLFPRSAKVGDENENDRFFRFHAPAPLWLFAGRTFGDSLPRHRLAGYAEL